MKPTQPLLVLLTLAVHAAKPAAIAQRTCGARPANGPINDTSLLNFALNLGTFQTTFYDQALSQFDDQAFQDVGLNQTVRGRYLQINESKRTQTALLNQTLGVNATLTCTYNFQFANVTNFTLQSQIIESIGVSAYIGSIQNLTNPEYQTAASSILSTSARYVSWIASTVNNVEPWDSAFDVPLTPNQVATLIAPYVVSCNTTNRFLPAPPLQVSEGAAGSNVTFSFGNSSADANSNNTALFAVFLQGLDQLSVPLTNDSATIPGNLTGIVYTLVTNSSSVVSDNTTVAGPAVLNLSMPSNDTSSGDEGSSSTSTTMSATTTSSSASETSTVSS